MSLPEVIEKLSHGAPAFFVRKQFVMLWSVTVMEARPVTAGCPCIESVVITE